MNNFEKKFLIVQKFLETDFVRKVTFAQMLYPHLKPKDANSKMIGKLKGRQKFTEEELDIILSEIQKFAKKIST